VVGSLDWMGFRPVRMFEPLLGDFHVSFLHRERVLVLLFPIRIPPGPAMWWVGIANSVSRFLMVPCLISYGTTLLMLA
jgi:hypothetical protein